MKNKHKKKKNTDNALIDEIKNQVVDQIGTAIKDNGPALIEAAMEIAESILKK